LVHPCEKKSINYLNNTLKPLNTNIPLPPFGQKIIKSDDVVTLRIIFGNSATKN
jgi:hypothetical protein